MYVEEMMCKTSDVAFISIEQGEKEYFTKTVLQFRRVGGHERETGASAYKGCRECHHAKWLGA